MLKIKGLLKFIALMELGISLLSVGSLTASASSKAYWGHFDSRRITYHIDSTSKHYRGIFKTAIKNWNDQGIVKLVNTNKKCKANIRLTTAKYVKGYDVGKIMFGEFAGSPTNEKITLVRSYLDSNNFTNKERTNIATAYLGITLGLNSDVSGDSLYSNISENHITPFDQANLKAAYKGVK